MMVLGFFKSHLEPIQRQLGFDKLSLTNQSSLTDVLSLTNDLSLTKEHNLTGNLRKLYVILLLFLFPTFAQAREIIVCGTCEVTSVKAAVELAEDGDVIRVKKGIYKEHDIKILHKSVSIIGEDYPVIDAEMKGTAISISADNVRIEGLKIINIGRSHTTDFAAILMTHSKHFQIINNRLENVFFGFLIEKSTGGSIGGNRIKSQAEREDTSGNGIHLWHSNEVEISNNRISGNRDGIYLEFSGNSTVRDNISKDNLRYGLHFMFSDNNRYADNVFESNGAGVAVMYSKNIKMYRNLFKDSWGPASYGLLLKEINDAELSRNIFDGNTVAINIDGTNRITYTENEFTNNGYGLKVKGACYQNIFERNNFLYNSFDLSYEGFLNQNEFNSNYWSGYSGYDLNKDGIGDVPYRPVKLFSYLVNKSPEAIMLLRSLFIDLIDFSERVSPIFTPAELVDATPQMKRIVW